MARRESKDSLWTRGSLTPCPSLLSLFPANACISAFCVLFLAVSKMGMAKERSFSPLVYLSLCLLLFKCENAGNYLAGKMWVYRKSLGRPIPRHSFYLSVLSPCQCPMPSPASIARTFSSNFLPCVCPIAAIDSWTVLMWPRLHSQHITLPLVTLLSSLSKPT